MKLESVPLKTLSEQPGPAPKDVLLDKHRELMRTAAMTQIVNRSVLTGILLLEIVRLRQPLFEVLAILAVGITTAVYWWLHALISRRTTNQLEEVLVEGSANSDSLDLSKSHSGAPPPTEEVPDPWVDAYVNWRHQRWKQSRLLMLQNLEPFIWIALLTALVLIRMLFRIF